MTQPKRYILLEYTLDESLSAQHIPWYTLLDGAVRVTNWKDIDVLTLATIGRDLGVEHILAANSDQEPAEVYTTLMQRNNGEENVTLPTLDLKEEYQSLTVPEVITILTTYGEERVSKLVEYFQIDLQEILKSSY